MQCWLVSSYRELRTEMQRQFERTIVQLRVTAANERVLQILGLCSIMVEMPATWRGEMHGDEPWSN